MRLKWHFTLLRQSVIDLTELALIAVAGLAVDPLELFNGSLFILAYNADAVSDDVLKAVLFAYYFPAFQDCPL